MINGHDFYNVMSAMVPLYVAMVLAYASVRWWKIFTAEQCSGINRFVATFAVPLLSFHFISSNNPYKMNLIFVAADTLQKVFLLLLLAVVGVVLRRRGEIAGSTPFEWLITLFSLGTLPNTLVMGIPLLEAMYGEASGAGSLMVQVVVLQAIVWYTLLLFLFEFRGAWTLIAERFPESAASIASFTVESDVISLDGREPLDTDAQILADGRLHITVRRSTSSGTTAFPRFSSLAGAEIFSVSSPESNYRGSNFNNSDFYRKSGFGPGDLSVGPTNTPQDWASAGGSPAPGLYPGRMIRSSTVNNNNSYPGPNPEIVGGRSRSTSGHYGRLQRKGSYGGKELHMFRWSTSESPAVEAFGGGRRAALAGERWRHSTDGVKDLRMISSDRPLIENAKEGNQEREFPVVAEGSVDEGGGGAETTTGNQMPPARVMTKLILVMVWRKLIRNPNTYSSIIGLVWSLVAYRWNVTMPKIIANSISILSNAGLGMAMFSLGLFMALQPKLIPCGKSLALFSMGVRFIVGPAVAAVASIAIGIRGDFLRISIVQAALPQGIVPFVFAKEYNNHPTILSTAVIFGMLVALPIDLLYYILLGL